MAAQRVPRPRAMRQRADHARRTRHVAARPDGEFDLPAEAREVADVTGAGDTVIAAMALGLAAGGSLSEAARLANRAAGLAVARFGPVAITAEELEAAL